MTPKTARSYSAKGKKKELSWLCFVASITLTVIQNNAESGPEWSFSRLGFLSLACCHSLHATRHEDRSPPHLSLKKGGRYYTYFNKEQHSVRVRRMHSILAPTLSSRVSLRLWFNSEPSFLRLQSTDSETASLLGLLSAGIRWARGYSARCRHCGAIPLCALHGRLGSCCYSQRLLVRLPGTSLTHHLVSGELWVLLPTRLAGDRGTALPFSNVQIGPPPHREFGPEGIGAGYLIRDALALWFSFLFFFWLPFFPTCSVLPSRGNYDLSWGRGGGVVGQQICLLPHSLANLLTNLRRDF